MLGTIIYNTDNDRVFNCINFFWLEGYIQLLIYNHFWRLRGSFLVPGIESELAVYKACTLPTISSLGLPQLHLNRYPASQDKALWTSGDCKSLFRGDRTRKVLVTWMVSPTSWCLLYKLVPPITWYGACHLLTLLFPQETSLNQTGVVITFCTWHYLTSKQPSSLGHKCSYCVWKWDRPSDPFCEIAIGGGWGKPSLAPSLVPIITTLSPKALNKFNKFPVSSQSKTWTLVVHSGKYSSLLGWLKRPKRWCIIEQRESESFP